MARLGAHPTRQPLSPPPNFSTWQAEPQHPAVNLPTSLSPAHVLMDPWPLHGGGSFRRGGRGGYEVSVFSREHPQRLARCLSW